MSLIHCMVIMLHSLIASLNSKLTHGVVQKVLRSGRVAEQWIGATKEVAKRVNNTACHDIIDRNGESKLRYTYAHARGPMTIGQNHELRVFSLYFTCYIPLW